MGTRWIGPRVISPANACPATCCGPRSAMVPPSSPKLDPAGGTRERSGAPEWECDIGLPLSPASEGGSKLSVGVLDPWAGILTLPSNEQSESDLIKTGAYAPSQFI
jgi:hypothetical protein